ncbi:MAG: hypothetical protein KBD21_04635 [Candidatus Pacebacteria bacterium]|nr:hypothetical protein [Candidatus Paceibacterota bacterium]
MTTYTLPLLFALIATGGNATKTMPPCEHYIATPDTTYCLTSRGTPVVQTPVVRLPEDASPYDDGIVYDEGEVLPIDVQYHDDAVMTDQVPQ